MDQTTMNRNRAHHIAAGIARAADAWPRGLPTGGRRHGLMNVLLVTLACWSLCGCATRAELVVLREGMDRATATIRRQHKEWAAKLAAGKPGALPQLTPADHRAVLTAHREYEALVRASRASDRQSKVDGP